MKTTVAKYAGFCFGVKRAVDFVFSLAESEREADIYTVGELIHNADVLGRLAERGVHAVSAAQAEEIIADGIYIRCNRTFRQAPCDYRLHELCRTCCKSTRATACPNICRGKYPNR